MTDAQMDVLSLIQENSVLRESHVGHRYTEELIKELLSKYNTKPEEEVHKSKLTLKRKGGLVLTSEDIPNPENHCLDIDDVPF